MRLLYVFAVSLWLTGCSSMSGLTGLFDKEEDPTPVSELQPIEPEIDIRVIWETRIGAGHTDSHSALKPALYRDRLFVADAEGLVAALDTGSGDPVWETESDLLLSSGPGTGDALIVVGSHNGDVLALDADDGSEQWRTTVSSEVLATPRIAGGIVVIRTIDGKLTGLDQETGEQRWVYERTVPALSIRGTGSPAVTQNWIIDGFASGKLAALQLRDGKLIWESNVAIPHGRSELDRLVDLDTDPAVTEDTIYIASYQGGVSAISLHDGDILWQREEMSSSTGLALDWRDFYLVDTASRIWALVQRNGAALWKQEKLLYRRLSTPVIHQNHVVVGDLEGYLHWFSTSDGHAVGRIRIDDEPIDSAPLVADDTLYVYSSGGTVSALTIAPLVADEASH